MSCVLVRLLGHDARPAHTATEALCVADAYGPDVIVLDLSLPDGSGYDVARAIRDRAARQPFIAAMTGWNGEEHRIRSVEAGIDVHVEKPASTENLVRIIELALARHKSC